MKFHERYLTSLSMNLHETLVNAAIPAGCGKDNHTKIVLEARFTI